MKFLKLVVASVIALALSLSAQAATLDTTYNSVGSYNLANNWFSTDGSFDANSGLVETAYLINGNIGGNAATVLNALNGLLTTSYDFSGTKYDGTDPNSWIGTTGGSILGSSPISAVLLKTNTYSLFAVFNTAVTDLYWNNEWTKLISPNGQAQNLSHYIIYDGELSEVPLPAAAFLFAPALLGLMGLRRKNKLS